jgi:hypothetical protein
MPALSSAMWVILFMHEQSLMSECVLLPSTRLIDQSQFMAWLCLRGEHV